MAKTAIVITSIIILIIGIVIAFSTISGTTTNLIDAADSVALANNCSDFIDSSGTAWVLNRTGGFFNCSNSSGFSQGADDESLPLSALFSRGGVTMLVLMVALFLVLLGYIIVRSRLKS